MGQEAVPANAHSQQPTSSHDASPSRGPLTSQTAPIFGFNIQTDEPVWNKPHYSTITSIDNLTVSKTDLVKTYF